LRPSSQAVDAAIAAAASKQHGNVKRPQLLGLGLDKYAIAYRVRIGRLFRVHRGVYAVGHPPVTPHQRAAAAVLACGAGAALSHGSAMTLWGFWKRWDRPFEITVPGDRRATGIAVHRSTTLHRRDVRTQLGIRVTTPARTLFDVSPRLSDKALMRAVNNALNSPWLTESQLEALITRLPPITGAGSPYRAQKAGKSSSQPERVGSPFILTNPASRPAPRWWGNRSTTSARSERRTSFRRNPSLTARASAF
jgi:hypothetical protein